MDGGIRQVDVFPAQENEYPVVAWGVPKHGEKVAPVMINRPNVGDYDIKIDMKYCGICHSDVHLARAELGGCVYPCVPGHELAGVVAEVGSKVTKFKVGDHAGVGCMVDACLECDSCKDGDENYCEKRSVMTYSGEKRFKGVGGHPEQQTFGGYSKVHVVQERFCFNLPEAIPLEKAGPLLCAGITMWDPIRNFGATKPGVKKCIGIIGVGGLGTMGIKLAKALGHRVVAISRSADKAELSKEKGADAFVVSTNEEQMKSETKQIDLILNTISANHDCGIYLPLLKKDGKIVQLGACISPHPISQLPLMFNRISVAGSIIGGCPSTQEMVNFCADNKVFPDVELIEADKIEWAWDQLTNLNKDGIRYVIDIEKSAQNPNFLPK
uniref:Enoyl reductase (ER) domain-containing protein n=1 Tax=Strombidium rassoulzadegani TaxID=1082188 RepID=A0A7S3CU76_9SPIT|eukprot:CAMPEP_0168614870 /NCGR_PEP_ID=MMETSP0449_2-20121227/4206_1 /TAXON_ID=1082188 /ORGANISM="Strombidium rassoulzadegani, Strain ras09" /LENGTH=382 /DNA_ID=CAMNT_0008655581 /DNA_START=14 /DNA_END=1162 /DNA_ORIENTATION=-